MTETHRGLPVQGYRDQGADQVRLVNRNKQLEEAILRVLDDLNRDLSVDKRWLAVARTHIEQGFMAANRAVFQPERVEVLCPSMLEDMLALSGPNRAVRPGALALSSSVAGMSASSCAPPA